MWLARDQGMWLGAHLGNHVDHAVLAADLHRDGKVLRRLGREVDVGRLLAEGRRALRLGARLYLDDVELREAGRHRARSAGVQAKWYPRRRTQR